MHVWGIDPHIRFVAASIYHAYAISPPTYKLFAMHLRITYLSAEELKSLT